MSQRPTGRPIVVLHLELDGGKKLTNPYLQSLGLMRGREKVAINSHHRRTLRDFHSCKLFETWGIFIPKNLIGRFSKLQLVTEKIIATTFQNAKSCL
jgi:hypothetical protein